MFDHTSRYFLLETGTFITQDNKSVAYKRRRFLPRGSRMPLLAEATVNDGDRLDVITARTLGDPQQYWRVADANDSMSPTELTEEVGRAIRIPVPQA